MKAISSFDPKKEAIVDIKYKSLMDTTRAGIGGPTSFIKLDSYHPDHMVYSYSAPRDVIAVFSEIYYEKGWKMLIDGVEKAKPKPASNKMEPASDIFSEIYYEKGWKMLIDGVEKPYFRADYVLDRKSVV